MYFLFMDAEAYVSVVLILSQKLDPIAFDRVDLPDLPEVDFPPLFFLEDASISPFICADAKVSVYAIRSKKALELLLVLPGLDADFGRLS
jgi:hypothetical protein